MRILIALLLVVFSMNTFSYKLYDTCVGVQDYFDMRDCVEEKINKGWELVGGIEVVNHEGRLYFYQSLTVDEKDLPLELSIEIEEELEEIPE